MFDNLNVVVSLSTLCTLGIPVVTFGEVTITSELNADPLTFNVTCTTLYGPVTSVAWRVDGSPVPNENNPITTQTVDNTTTGAYTLTLSVTGRLTGTYNCRVTSVRPEFVRLAPRMYVTSAEMTISGKYDSVIVYFTIALHYHYTFGIGATGFQ